MIISRTPLRISFAGGGSDLAAFYRHQPGMVVSTAINKYIYIAVNRKFDDKIRASYSVTEIVDKVDDLQHELIRETLRLLDIDGGIEIVSVSDIPSHGTGVGSSSSYVVGLLHALHVYKGEYAGADRLAQEACHIEIDLCGKPIGKQDQYIAAYGGLQCIRFYEDESVCVEPVLCSDAVKTKLERHLLLLYTGLKRSSDDVLQEQQHNTASSVVIREGLGTMVVYAQELRRALERCSLSRFGELLDRSWRAKKLLADGISNPVIDEWYEIACNHGALGGKIAGAGGGGFLLLFAPPERHDEIVQALPGLRPIDIRFEPQGSKIIYEGENG
jgi:D-glycero-alpha-D-manno-heptose-7-phosphate kinase